MKFKIITENDKSHFEKMLELEVLALQSDGKKVKDIKYSYSLVNGQQDIHSAMIISEWVVKEVIS